MRHTPSPSRTVVANRRNYYYCEECARIQRIQPCILCDRITRGAGRSASPQTIFTRQYEYSRATGTSSAFRNTVNHSRHTLGLAPLSAAYATILSRGEATVCGACIDATTGTCMECGVHYNMMPGIIQTDNMCYHCSVTRPCCRCGARSRNVGTMDIFNVNSKSICLNCRYVPVSPQSRQPGTLVGFELEFLAPRGRIIDLQEWGVVHHDGSICVQGGDDMPLPDVEYRGREFASFPAYGDELHRNIHNVMETVKEAYGYVNPSCGLHTHYDMRDMRVNQQYITAWWWYFQPFFLRMVPDHRRANSYCQPLRNPNDYGGNRYSALNTTALSEHGTLEIRLFHATLNPQELIPWTILMRAFCNTFADLPFHDNLQLEDDREKLLFLLHQLKLPLRVRKWMYRQAKQVGKCSILNPENVPAVIRQRRPRPLSELLQSLQETTNMISGRLSVSDFTSLYGQVSYIPGQSTSIPATTGGNS